MHRIPAEGATMKLWKHDVPGSSQISSSIIEDERRQKLVHEKQVGLSTRARGIDCMLVDIEMQIRKLRQERIHLSLVREGLTNRLSGLRRNVDVA